MESCDFTSRGFNGLTQDEQKMDWAMSSREDVMKDEKFIQIFSEYTEAIGINKPQEIEAWAPIIKKKEEITIQNAVLEAQRLKD